MTTVEGNNGSVRVNVSQNVTSSSPNRTIELKPATFEEALNATGFGKFNYILIGILLLPVLSQNVETSLMSFVFPAAQCDLELTLMEKGLLNSVSFVGMISTGFIWGYLCDTLGRRKILFIGLLVDGILVFLSSLSPNVEFLLVLKFFGGTIINGPVSALVAYLAELNCAKYRATVQMIMGVCIGASNLILPLLAWLILPLNLHLVISDYFHYHAWNLLITVCSLPALLSGIAFYFLPESPKFLMAVGQGNKALEVFRFIYKMNTGKSPETYPILNLVDETQSDNSNDKLKAKITLNRTKIQALKEGYQQISPLFSSPYILKLILVCIIDFLLFEGGRTLNLWLPQILQVINDYKTISDDGPTNFCTMIESVNNISTTKTGECFVNLNNSFVYINTIIVASIRILLFSLAGILINLVGQKGLLYISCIISGASVLILSLSNNNIMTVALLATSTTFIGICPQIMLSLVVVLFPTVFRTVTVSLVYTLGRTGAMTGNVIFPALLEIGCMPPFFFIGASILITIFLIFLLPKEGSSQFQ